LSSNEDDEGYLRVAPPTPFEIAKGKGKGVTMEEATREKRIRLTRRIMDFGGLVPEEGRYLDEKWRLCEVGGNLVLFVNRFINKLGAEAGGSYDRFLKYYGRPTWKERSELSAFPPENYAAFAEELKGFPKDRLLTAQFNGVEGARERGYYSDNQFVCFRGAGLSSKHPPKLSYINTLGDECTGALGTLTLAHLNYIGKLNVTRRYNFSTHWETLAEYGATAFKRIEKKVIDRTERVSFQGVDLAFHMKIMELSDTQDASLNMGWSWQNDHHGGASIVGDPRCGIGVSSYYTAAGSATFGKTTVSAPVLKVGDVLSCFLKIINTDTDSYQEKPSDHETHSFYIHRKQPLLASFAVNGKPIDVSHSWSYQELFDQNLMLDRRWLPTANHSVSHDVSLVPVVFGAGFKVRALEVSGLQYCGRGRDSMRRVFSGLAEECLINISEAVPLGGVKCFVELLKSGTPKAKEAVCPCFASKAPDSSERKEMINMSVVSLLVEFCKMSSEETLDSLRDRRESAASALRAFAKEGESGAIVAAGAIPVLLNMVKESTASARQNSLNTLSEIANDTSVLDALLKAGSIPCVEDILRNADATKEYQEGWGTTLLSRLAKVPDGTKAIAEKPSLIKMLVDMVKKAEPMRARADAAYCLAKLVQNEPEFQKKIAEDTKVIQYLVDTLSVLWSYCGEGNSVESSRDLCCVMLALRVCTQNNELNLALAAEAKVIESLIKMVQKGEPGQRKWTEHRLELYKDVMQVYGELAEGSKSNKRFLSGLAGVLDKLCQIVKDSQKEPERKGWKEAEVFLTNFARHSEANNVKVGRALVEAKITHLKL